MTLTQRDLVTLMRTLDPCANRGALLGCRDVRRAAGLPYKAAFDALTLMAARDGLVSLHRHDAPSWLTQAERDEMVTDGREFYVGMAIRQGVR